MSSTTNGVAKIPLPAPRFAKVSEDVWTMINTAAAESPKQPICNLGQGFMNFLPPHYVTEAVKSTIDLIPSNQYSPPRGRPRLLSALSAAYTPFFSSTLGGRPLNPNTEIVVTAGANEGILAALTAFVGEGDEVIVMEPYFDQYISNIEMQGAKVVYVPIRPPTNGNLNNPASEWKLDMAELESKITPRAKAIILNTPHNPIGKVFSRSELVAIGEIAERHNLLIISDEVYDRLSFSPGGHQRIATLSPALYARTLTVGSAGKTFGCTGWRVGWLLGPEHLVRYVLAAHTRITFCVNSPMQEAIATGFERAEEEGYYETTVREYKARYEILCGAFDKLGLPYTIPDGGYFLLVNFARVHIPSDYEFPSTIQSRARDFKLAYWLTREIGVVAIPPTEFFTEENWGLAEDYLRFAVCKTEETLIEAGRRLGGLREFIRDE
ncbi:arylformamidase [Saitoella coloradoensis]